MKAANVYDDGFIGIEGDIWIRTGDTGILNINLYCPFELTGEEGYKIYINGSEMVSAKAENGEMLQNISTNLVNQVVALHIETNFTKKPDNGDLRDLSLKITNVEAE